MFIFIWSRRGSNEGGGRHNRDKEANAGISFTTSPNSAASTSFNLFEYNSALGQIRAENLPGTRRGLDGLNIGFVTTAHLEGRSTDGAGTSVTLEQDSGGATRHAWA